MAINRKQTLELAVVVAVLGAGMLALRLFDPATSHLFPPCPLYVLTGWYCPGCGTLRAFHQLLHGNLRNAFNLNPLAMLSLPFVVYGGASYAAFQLRGRHLPHIFIPAAWIWALAVVVVLFGILRNIPVYPLVLLKPGGGLIS